MLFLWTIGDLDENTFIPHATNYICISVTDLIVFMLMVIRLNFFVIFDLRDRFVPIKAIKLLNMQHAFRSFFINWPKMFNVLQTEH